MVDAPDGSVVVVVVGAGGGSGMVVGKLLEMGDVEDVPGLRRYRGIPEGDSLFFSLVPPPFDKVEGVAGDACPCFTSSFIGVVLVATVVVLLGSLPGSEPTAAAVPPFDAA